MMTDHLIIDNLIFIDFRIFIHILVLYCVNYTNKSVYLFINYLYILMRVLIIERVTFIFKFFIHADESVNHIKSSDI